jgi:transposase-like protein
MARIAPPLKEHKHYQTICEQLILGTAVRKLAQRYDVSEQSLYRQRSLLRDKALESNNQTTQKIVLSEAIPADVVNSRQIRETVPKSTEPELERLRRELSTLYKAAAGQGDVRIANQVARTQLDALKLRASLRGELQAPSSQSTVVVLIPSKLRERGMRTVGRASVQAVPDSEAPVVEIEADSVDE